MNNNRKKDIRKFPIEAHDVELWLVKKIFFCKIIFELTEVVEAFSSCFCWVCQEKNQIAAILSFNTYHHWLSFLHQDRWCFPQLTSQFLGIYWHRSLQPLLTSFFMPPILTTFRVFYLHVILLGWLVQIL